MSRSTSFLPPLHPLNIAMEEAQGSVKGTVSPTADSYFSVAPMADARNSFTPTLPTQSQTLIAPIIHAQALPPFTVDAQTSTTSTPKARSFAPPPPSPPPSLPPAPFVPPPASLDSILNMTVAEFLNASVNHESSPAALLSSLSNINLPHAAPNPILIAQSVHSNKVTKKIALTRSKVDSWSGPDVLQRLVQLLGLPEYDLNRYALEASFTVLTSKSNSRVPIDVDSWRDMLPYISTLWVFVRD
ncbi:hypothetical protein HWV62_34673 [Athelia sp. TMB]|nr:hypothetical protein HWV62_34673 [Athelia sp. TMB]